MRMLIGIGQVISTTRHRVRAEREIPGSGATSRFQARLPIGPWRAGTEFAARPSSPATPTGAITPAPQRSLSGSGAGRRLPVDTHAIRRR